MNLCKEPVIYDTASSGATEMTLRGQLYMASFKSSHRASRTPSYIGALARTPGLRTCAPYGVKVERTKISLLNTRSTLSSSIHMPFRSNLRDGHCSFSQ
jgi:hypothetical protein